MDDSHPLLSMSIRHRIPEIRLFQILTLKFQGQGDGCGQRVRSYSWPSILLTCFLLISHQSDQQSLRYSYFEIWPWNIQGQGHEWGPCFPLVLISVGNSHRSASPRPTTLEQDRELFVDFSSILCLLFEFQGMRTYNFFDWVSNTGSDASKLRTFQGSFPDQISCYDIYSEFHNVAQSLKPKMFFSLIHSFKKFGFSAARSAHSIFRRPGFNIYRVHHMWLKSVVSILS